MSRNPDFLQRFSIEASRSDALPERLALFIAGMAYPDLNIDNQVHILNRIAERVAKSLENLPPGEQRAVRFLSVINHEFEFDGNRADYYDVRNSFLNDVLERRVGLPITLCVVCMAVGRRLQKMGFDDLSIDGLGLPSHFMTRYEDEAGVWLLDPFNGVIILPNQVGGYLSNMFDSQWSGTGVTLPPEVLKPVSPKKVALRMLNNLRMVFLHEENLLSAIQVLDYMLVLVPRDPELWRERGLLNYQCENWERAERDIRRYFFLNGNLIATMGHSDIEIAFDFPIDEEPFFGTTLNGLDDDDSYDGDVDYDDVDYDDVDYDDVDYDGVDYDASDGGPLDDADNISEVYFEDIDELTSEEQNLLYILSDIAQERAKLN